MKVKAKRLGYYANIRIKEGQKFRLKDSKHFSGEWMEKLSKNVKVDEVLIQDKPEPIPNVLLDDADDEQDDADSNSEVI